MVYMVLVESWLSVVGIGIDGVGVEVGERDVVGVSIVFTITNLCIDHDIEFEWCALCW